MFALLFDGQILHGYFSAHLLPQSEASLPRAITGGRKPFAKHLALASSRNKGESGS